MFNGVPSDHFHHFIASSRTSLPIPLSTFPSFSAGFGLYPSPSSLQNSDQTLQQLHIQAESLHGKINNDQEDRSKDSWSNDEVVALLKVRSSMENWFPDFSWEHVSRKLAELGFRRRADECKEKFEEESERISYSKNYRIFGELEEFYPNGGQQETRGVSSERISAREMERQHEENQDKKNSGNLEAAATPNPHQEMSEEVVKKPETKPNKKRKRKDKFEIFKGFVEVIVSKMMAKQEELHNKLIEDLLKKDEEKIAREEARKNSEMERMKMEIEKRAEEQASAGERQAIIIDFLKKFTSEGQQFADKIQDIKVKVNNLQNSSTSLCEVQSTQDKGETSTTSNSSTILAHQNPNSFPSQKSSKSHKTPSLPRKPTSTLAIKDSKEKETIPSLIPFDSNYDQKGDIGMRWPKDQVLALINLRCKLSTTTTNNIDSKEGAKGPLWERISQGMLELGYKRSAKRCKEKWENINKYFRKTKDSNKKRSIDSRTCPYFHQLSCLYSEGTLVAPTDVPENQL